eukprot:1165563-Alexandrium_andersonii.AAC.1
MVANSRARTMIQERGAAAERAMNAKWLAPSAFCTVFSKKPRGKIRLRRSQPEPPVASRRRA